MQKHLYHPIHLVDGSKIAWVKSESVDTIVGDPVVAFLTCGREELTKKTLHSFAKYCNGNWTKYYADDASADQPAMRRIVESYGFQPLVLNTRRTGCSKTTDLLAKEVLRNAGRDRMVLYLQNDFELLRKMPVNEMAYLLENHADWVRLGREYQGVNNPKKVWVNEECFDVGQSAFAYNTPPVMRSQTFAYIVDKARCEGDACRKGSNMIAARPVKSIARHIGGHRLNNGHFSMMTPGGIFR